jgi:hypothetical protein
MEGGLGISGASGGADRASPGSGAVAEGGAVKRPSQAEIETTDFWFGEKRIQFASITQWVLTFDPHEEIAVVGGPGSSKTMGGIYRATRLSCWYPGNKGIIGRFASTDLAATTQADALAFWGDANLLEDFVQRGKYKVPTAVLRCLDPRTNKIIPNKFSEVLFVHLDDPNHVRSHTLGWGWIEESNECSLAARNELSKRLRRKGFENIYSLWETQNPNGKDRVYDHYFNEEMLAELAEKKPRAYAKRLGLRSPTYENRFLPAEYIQNMEDTLSDKERRRALEVTFDDFEGQVCEEWNEAVHTFDMEECFPHGIPETWNRLLACDPGGIDPWGWLWVAVDPHGNILAYEEISLPGVRTKVFAELALPRMKGLRFQSKVIDYENRAVAHELSEMGIPFSNAKKHNKNDSIFRLNGYLHPSRNHGHPEWHPKAGRGGSPRLFVARNLRRLRKEIPQARWMRRKNSETFENMLDPRPGGPDDVFHCLLYIIRELPRPAEIERTIVGDLSPELDAMSRIMHFEAELAKLRKKRSRWDRRSRPTIHGIPVDLLEKVQQ